MSNKPSHVAYVVVNPAGRPDQKALWREVGAVWPHKSGTGFDLVVHQGLTVYGRIVCTERKEKTEEPAAQS